MWRASHSINQAISFLSIQLCPLRSNSCSFCGAEFSSLLFLFPRVEEIICWCFDRQFEAWEFSSEMMEGAYWVTIHYSRAKCRCIYGFHLGKGNGRRVNDDWTVPCLTLLWPIFQAAVLRCSCLCDGITRPTPWTRVVATCQVWSLTPSEPSALWSPTPGLHVDLRKVASESTTWPVPGVAAAARSVTASTHS